MKERSKSPDLDEIFLKFRPIISFRVKRSLGSYNPDWEDIVNEIITNVIEKIKGGEFRAESSIGTFIYTITSRRIVDYIREKTRILRHAPEPIPLPDPCETIEDEERTEWIAAAINKLKPKFKEVLYLYYYKELSREEVAQKLGISARKVSERVNYAHKLLKKMLKK